MLKRRSRQSGQTAILYTVGLTAVFGMVGLVSDVGYMYYRKQNAQAAAQAAALASVKTAYTVSSGGFACGTGTTNVGCNSNYVCPASISGSGSNNLEVACLYAQKNGYSGNNVWLEANTGNINGVRTTYYTVAHVRETLPVLFSAIWGSNSSLVVARSVVAYTPGSGGGCIYALDNNSGDPGTLAVNGTGSLSTGCGVWVDGPNSNAANLNGGGQITVTGTGQSVQIVGGYSCAGGSTGCITPAPTTGADPTGDPMAGLPAPTIPPGCTSPSWAGQSGSFNNPGGGTIRVCGDLNINANKTFTFPAGTYVFTGCNNGGNQGFSVSGNATVTGTGVFFYFTDNCSAQVTGGGYVKLTAPTSGTYTGVLMYEDPTDAANTPQLSGCTTQLLNGVVYFPADNLQYSGGSTQVGNSQSLSIIAWQIKITGNSVIQNAGNSPYLTSSPGVAVLE